MSAIANSLTTISSVHHWVLHSEQLRVISLIALAVLTLLTLTLSAWATMKCATVYGTNAIAQHWSYTALLPLTITAMIVRALALLSNCPKQSSSRVSTSSTPAVEEYVSQMPGRYVHSLQVGDTVHQGQILYELEVMKMYMNVRASETGKITKIFVPSGTNVKYNQPLFQITKISSCQN